MGDILCSLKTAYLFVNNTPDVDKVIVSLSPKNEMHFLLEKFLDDPKGDGSVPKCEVVWDDFDPGNWPQRWTAWEKWRTDRTIEGQSFDHFRVLYLRIHGAQMQRALCGSERGLGHVIYEYWWRGQEDAPNEPPRDADEWVNHGVPTRYSFGDGLVHHPPSTRERDVYISPHAKTQGNSTFTFQFWADVVRHLLDAGVSVTVGYDGHFCEELLTHPLYRKFWGGMGVDGHKAWMAEVCRHKLVACGNTGTGWLAAACGVPMLTVEPPGSQMPDHRYRECGLRNIVEVVDVPDPSYVARRIIEEVQRKVVMTTGCYDVLHSGHVRHLERSREMGTRLVVALNSDSSVRRLKGTERPFNPENQRRAVLEALRCVDEVRVFDDTSPISVIREVRPDVLTAGYGYRPESVVGREFVEGYGGRVAITCPGDARDEPSTTKILNRVRSADVVDLCRMAASASVNPFEKLKLMADQLLSVKELPGDVADLGTCRGGTALILRRLAPDRHLHLFDTWDGTPYDDPMCHHKRGEWAASMDECRKLVGNGELIHYHRGVFPKVVALADDSDKFCFVYVDVDTYQATRDAVEFFWPRMVPGGKILIDDYNWNPCAGVKKAVDEASAGKKINVIQSLYTCILEK